LGMSHRSWTAPRKVKALWCPLCLLSAIACAAAAIAGLAGLVKGEPLAVTGLLLAPGAYMLGRAALRIPRAGVSIDSTQIVVVGPMRTVRTPIADAQGFVAVVRPGGLGQPTISLHLRGARSVGIWALNPKGFIWRFGLFFPSLHPLVDELNHALSIARGSASGLPS
jgi:hypothetical protein